MSMNALLVAVRDRLRQHLDVPPEAIEIMADGRPSPAVGDVFVAVTEGEWRLDESIGAGDLMLPETFGVEVVVTRKCGVAPFARIGTAILAEAQRGLTALCRKVVVAVHNSYVVMAAANAEVTTATDGFHHPLVFVNAGRTMPQGPDWFQAKGQKSSPPCGLSRTLVFGRAQRVQKLEHAQ